MVEYFWKSNILMMSTSWDHTDRFLPNCWENIDFAPIQGELMLAKKILNVFGSRVKIHYSTFYDTMSRYAYIRSFAFWLLRFLFAYAVFLNISASTTAFEVCIPRFIVRRRRDGDSDLLDVSICRHLKISFWYDVSQEWSLRNLITYSDVDDNF